MWYDKPNGFFTTTDYFNTCAALRNSPPAATHQLHHRTRARRYPTTSSTRRGSLRSRARPYEDVIGIQMQRNMTKFDDLPGPADTTPRWRCCSSTRRRGCLRLVNVDPCRDAALHAVRAALPRPEHQARFVLIDYLDDRHHGPRRACSGAPACAARRRLRRGHPHRSGARAARARSLADARLARAVSAPRAQRRRRAMAQEQLDAAASDPLIRIHARQAGRAKRWSTAARLALRRAGRRLKWRGTRSTC